MRQIEKVQSPVLASFSALRKDPETKAVAGAQIIIAIKQLQQRLNLKRDMSDEQIAMFANDVLTDTDFNIACLALFPDFCRRFATGKFGELYESLDGMKLSLALRQYLFDYAKQMQALEREAESERRAADVARVVQAMPVDGMAAQVHERETPATRNARIMAECEAERKLALAKDMHRAAAFQTSLLPLTLAELDAKALGLTDVNERRMVSQRIAYLLATENNFAETLDNSKTGL